MNGLTHYRYIDALRGFAFLGVLTVHASQEVKSLPGGYIADAGMYGVQLFFLLSAVTLLRSVSLRSGKERFPTRNFFIRRFFRIAPLFWFGMAFYFLLDGCRPQFWSPHGNGLWQFLSTALFLHGWAPTTINSVVPGGWSIAVEMTFYACLPFLASRIRSPWAALSATFFAMLGSIALERLLHPALLRVVPGNEQYLVPYFLLYWFPSQLPVFLMGFIVYHSLHSAAVTGALAAPRRPALLAMIAVSGLAGLTRMDSALIPMQILYSAAFALLIVALAARPLAILVNRMTCGLGTISFSCYVTHFAAIRVAVHFIRSDSFAFSPSLWGPVCRFAAIWIIGLALTVAASAVTYLLIEKPGIRLGNRIIRRHEAEKTSHTHPCHGK